MASCHAALIEQTLSRGDYDFPAKYLAAKELNDLIRDEPEAVFSGTVNVIETLFRNPVIRNETQSYFLFRELTRALCGIGVRDVKRRAENAAFSVLFDILENMSGRAHRAAAEAVGSLHFRIHGPVVDAGAPSDIPVVPVDTVYKRAGVATPDCPQRMGRSLVFPLGAGKNGEESARGRILVLKTDDRDALSCLYREAWWMGWIGDHKGESRGSFHVPRVILNHA